MWAPNTTSGYLVNCELYQGKNSRRPEIYEKDFGKAAAPFVTMLNELRGAKDRPYELYFDNLFTGLNLLEHVKRKGISGHWYCSRKSHSKKLSYVVQKNSRKKKEEVHTKEGLKEKQVV
ncbi:hypothetical protein NQ314_013312 [Rhamnusium bicolor]|uniref:PiggyBac transposable element-derived protein domain-containing protein n=1 Tax=Rhamnusium bicolor TaxID=1586634 RepID=A0AAV8X725_9CUCU|nr:hypothetical protein NQ314_013312 [Rhamnusium bicolor]